MNPPFIEFGKETAEVAMACIDNLPHDMRESYKSVCLSNDEEYLKFISTVTNSSPAEVKKLFPSTKGKKSSTQYFRIV